MVSSKLTPRRSTARKPSICKSPKPPIVTPPPPPPPWPPDSIHYLGHLYIDAWSGPYWFHPEGDAPRDPATGHYPTVIDDGYSWWSLDFWITPGTRHIAGTGYGTNSDWDFWGADWDGPDLPDPWTGPVLLTTTFPFGLISEESYVSPTP